VVEDDPVPDEPVEEDAPQEVVDPKELRRRKFAEVQRKAREKDGYGWIDPEAPCSLCKKPAGFQGGVYCGRKRDDGTVVGCHKAYCWRCMKKGSAAEIGPIRMKKEDFLEAEGDPTMQWWMHRTCMSKDDVRDFYGEDEEDAPPAKKEDNFASFAWE
jgi:hypothetical protein